MLRTDLCQTKDSREVCHCIGPHCAACAAGLGEPKSVLAVRSEEQGSGAGADDCKDNGRNSDIALAPEQELVAQHRKNPHAEAENKQHSRLCSERASDTENMYICRLRHNWRNYVFCTKSQRFSAECHYRHGLQWRTNEYGKIVDTGRAKARIIQHTIQWGDNADECKCISFSAAATARYTVAVLGLLP